MQTKVIAIVNQKGGVGKTTTTQHLGYELAKTGKKVLMVDLDPQASLSTVFGIEDTESIPTVYNMMMAAADEKPMPDATVHLTNKLDLIPSSIELSTMEMQLISTMNREHVLGLVLNGFVGQYDYILVDCMPSLSMLTINALAACNDVLIVSTAEILSSKGLQQLLATILKIKRFMNPELTIDGILLTKYSDRFRAERKVKELTITAYSDIVSVFDVTIPVSVKVSESQLDGKTVGELQDGNHVAEAYRKFANEFIGGRK